MKPQKLSFLFLFISIFVLFVSTNCSNSKGLSSKKPPNKPGSPPVVEPYLPSPDNNHLARFLIKNLPDIPVEIQILRGGTNSQCADNNLVLLHKTSVGASQNEIEINMKKTEIANQSGNYRVFVKIMDSDGVLIGNCFYADFNLDPLDKSPPRVLANTLNHDPLANDDTPQSSKTWSWTCLDDVSSNCTYRYHIGTTALASGATGCPSYTFPSSKNYGNEFKATISFENRSDHTTIQNDGKYCIHIQAKDGAGNQSPVVSVYATLAESATPGPDTTPPRVLANTLNPSPLENDDTSKSSKTWSWTCLDDVSSSCTYRYHIAPLIGISCTPHSFGNNDSYGNKYRAKIGFENRPNDPNYRRITADGKYCIHIQAKDGAGNQSPVVSVYATLAESATPGPDTTPPRVLANTLNPSPLENDDTSKSSKTWSWTCLDDVVGSSCTYRYHIDTNPLTASTCTPHNFGNNDSDYGNKIQATIGFENRPNDPTYTRVTADGKYCIHIQARDGSGNHSPVVSVYATLAESAPPGPDTTPPRVVADSLNNPLANDDASRSLKTWNWTCRDDVSSSCTYRYHIDGTPLTGTSSCTPHNFGNSDYGDKVQATIGFEGTPDRRVTANGKYCIHIQAKDGAGNQSPVVSVYATLARTAPQFLLKPPLVSPSRERYPQFLIRNLAPLPTSIELFRGSSSSRCGTPNLYSGLTEIGSYTPIQNNYEITDLSGNDVPDASGRYRFFVRIIYSGNRESCLSLDYTLDKSPPSCCCRDRKFSGR